MVGLNEKRLLTMLYPRHMKGEAFPTVDEACSSRLLDSRGVASRAYARLERRGLVERDGHYWQSGRLTASGVRAAKAAVATAGELTKAPHGVGAKHWRPDMGMRTVFPSMVREASVGSKPLKFGNGVSKLGGWVTKGRLKGASIWYLTLEERKTCPTTCKLLSTCYGDVMARSVRWEMNDTLLDAIRDQLLQWDRYHRRRQASQRLIRLHELGDFTSPEYVRFWREQLDTYDWLHIFGFTAWDKTSAIGKAIRETRDQHGWRFSIRWSGSKREHGATTFTTMPPEGTFACPEQTRRVVNCAACGACWATTKAVAFREH